MIPKIKNKGITTTTRIIAVTNYKILTIEFCKELFFYMKIFKKRF